MNSDTKALRIVSLLFLVGAVLSVAELILSFTQNRLFIPWGILGFWIYFHLPMYRRPWRTVAWVMLLIPIAVVPVISLLAMISGAPTFIEIVGIRITQVSKPAFLFMGSCVWLLSFWQFNVLMRPSIRERFETNAQVEPFPHRRPLRILGLTAAVALIAVVVWNTGRGYRSSTFSGPDFHAENSADCSAVFSKLTDFLDSKGFSKSPSPSEWDSWAGVHSEGANRLWFVKDEAKKGYTHLYVDLDKRHVRTSIKWGVYGSQASAREAKAGAMRLAIEVDDWIANLPEPSILPDRLKEEKRQWFESELAQLVQG